MADARYVTAALIGAGLAAQPLSVAAQAAADDPNAPRAELRISQQIAVDNGDVIGVTPLSFQLKTGTRAQTIDLTLSAPFEYRPGDDGRRFRVANPQGQLRWQRFNATSSLQFQAGYREADIDDINSYELVVTDNGDLDILVETADGTRRDSDAQLRYSFGSQSNLGGDFSLGYRRTEYSLDAPVTSGSYNDSETHSASGTVYLEPNPMIRARIMASLSDTDSDGGTDVRARSGALGAAMQIDPLNHLDAQIGWDHIRRTSDATGAVEDAKGVSGALVYTRPAKDGEWEVRYDTQPNTSGRRENLTFGRSYDGRSVDLSFTLGATRVDQGKIDSILSLGYAQVLSPTVKLAVNADRRGVTDSDGDTAINTSLRASYSQQLDAASQLSAQLGLRETTARSGAAADGRTISLSVGYNRALTEAVGLEAGYRVQRVRDAQDKTTTDERVYLGLGTRFRWTP